MTYSAMVSINLLQTDEKGDVTTLEAEFSIIRFEDLDEACDIECPRILRASNAVMKRIIQQAIERNFALKTDFTGHSVPENE